MSVDFPRAWQIAKTVKTEYHHNDCSYNKTNGSILCDCDVIYKHPDYLDDVMHTRVIEKEPNNE